MLQSTTITTHGCLMNQPPQHSNKASATAQRKWYQQVPDPMVLIFLILVAAYLMTFIVPAGEFERETIEIGRAHV